MGAVGIVVYNLVPELRLEAHSDFLMVREHQVVVTISQLLTPTEEIP